MPALDQINQGGTIYEIVPEIAELFKTTKAYHTGDHVIYEAGWYTFKADKSAGVWDATKVNGPFKVTDQLSDLKEDLSGVETSIGDLSNLTTSAKGNLVAAINEAAQSGGSVEIALPKMYITGDISEMTAEKNEVKKYSYVFVDPDGEQHFGYCSMKWQGESSLTYPKKNYTIKFFYDAPHSRKEKVDLLPLGITKNKFVVKANWIDRSMARNVVSCRLWGQMVKSRHTAPPTLLAGSPNFGAINGYPIEMYVNGEFHGLYTFNLSKDEDLFGMDADNPLHCVVCGDNNANDNNNSSAFRTATIGNGNWELEVPDEWQTYDVEEEGQTVTYAVKDNLSNTIAFVINSTDEEFVAGINDHIDLESAIDYFLLMFIDRGVDSAARNLILLTYDGGNKWYCSAYDKDMTWGNGSMGNPAYTADTACPGGYINTNSLLWERLVECFGDDIWERWSELKTTILSPDYIKAEFEYFWKDITDADYAADIAKWPTIPQSTYDFKYQIFALIDARWTYMDSQINALRTPIACTGITLSESSLSFTSGDPVTLTATVEPADTTDAVVWSSSNTSVATVNNGVVTPVGEGNATITATCGSQTATCSVSVSSMHFTVTLAGTGATLTPTTNINPNAPYTGTLTANTGYTIDSVVVTMGGVDITSTAYSDGSISIASVTGDITVTVVASVSIDPTGLAYTLQSPLTFDGQTYADTGYKYSGSGSLSIFVEAENPQDMNTTQWLFGQKTGNTARMCWSATNRTLSPSLNSGNLQSGVDANIGTRFKAVFRFDADRTVQTNRSSVSGVEKTNSYGYNTNGVTPPASVWGNNLWLGGMNADGTLIDPMLTGKMYQFRIYERRLTDAETAALLGLSSLSNTITADKDPVSVPCTGITLDESTLTVATGSTATLTATPYPSNTTDTVSWSSSDTSVATVSSGVITPVAAGSATITATCGSYSATCSVTVTASSDVDTTGLVYTLASPITFDGQTYVDTEYEYDGEKSLTVFVEAENPENMNTTQWLFGQKTGSTARLSWKAGTRTLNPALNSGNLQSGVGSTASIRFKAVFRFDSTRGVQSNRSSVDGVEKTNSYGINTSGTQTPRDTWSNSLYLGGMNADGTLIDPMLTGKMYQFRIYERRLTDSETAALLGLSSLSTTPFTVDLDPAS